MKKTTVYMVCDFMVGEAGDCAGRILYENGKEIGRHYSTSLDMLRLELKGKLGSINKPYDFEVVDIFWDPKPERFKL